MALTLMESLFITAVVVTGFCVIVDTLNYLELEEGSVCPCHVIEGYNRKIFYQNSLYRFPSNFFH